MVTLVIGLAIKYTIGLRIAEEDEVEGIDFVAHGESAYDLHTGSRRRLAPPPASSPPKTAPVTEGAKA